MPYVIGVDVGSQSVKGVLLDSAGRTAGTACAALEISHPNPGWAEQEPTEWEAGLTAVVRELMQGSDVTPRDITMLSLACQVDGVVPIDAAGEAVTSAIIWLDRRAEAESDALTRLVGADRLFATTGLVPDSSHTGPKILWLREHQREIFDRAAAFPPAAGYLLKRLTGILAIDHANASSSLLYDVRARAWSDELLQAAGLSAEQLGDLRESTDVIGPLTEDAADRLGLTTSCGVLVGTGDDHAGALGAGVIEPGPVADITGTAEPIAACSDVAVLDPGRLVETHAHAVPGRFLVENPGFVSGGSTLWLSRVFGTSQGDVLELAAEAPPGCDGVVFIPALSGSMTPRWNARMRGAFTGLSMAHGRATLARAVVEGCCFALRDVTERLGDLGIGDGEIRVVGGGARSAMWLASKADVTGRPVRAVEVEEATALGAALLAAVAADFFTDLTEAVRACVRLADEPLQPNPDNRALYDDAYGRYRELFDATEKVAT